MLLLTSHFRFLLLTDTAAPSVLSKAPAAPPAPVEESHPKPTAARQYNNPRGLYSGPKADQEHSDHSSKLVEEQQR